MRGYGVGGVMPQIIGLDVRLVVPLLSVLHRNHVATKNNEMLARSLTS